MSGRVLVARLDNLGDVLLAGPAVRAVAAHAEHVVLLAGPRGRAAADLLPGVDEVVEYRAPWIDPEPPPVTPESVDDLVKRLRDLRPDTALILTSFHQSPLPLALVLRMAGVGRIGGISEDYPGSLLDVRHRVTGDPPEAERALSLVRRAGYGLPPGDDGRLALRGPLPDTRALTGPPGYVVLHPAASVPARQPTPGHAAALGRALAAAGHRLVVTGSAADRALTARVTAEARAGAAPAPAGDTAPTGDTALADGTAPADDAAPTDDAVPGGGPVSGSGGPAAVTDLGGVTDLAGLASVLAHARVVVAPNSGPAHLAAAVGTPVVSLFAPVVPASRWAPYGVPRVLLGDRDAPCAGTRARECPVPGHPCLAVDPGEVVDAVRVLAGRGRRADTQPTGGVP